MKLRPIIFIIFLLLIPFVASAESKPKPAIARIWHGQVAAAKPKNTRST